MLDVVSQWVAHYGYILVAVFLLIEATGVPIPGETALVTAAALAGRGTMTLWGVLIAGWAGTVAGGHVGYWIGKRGGTKFAARHGKWIGLTPARLARMHHFFDEHGANTVLLARFVAFVRSFIGIFAGMTGMPFRTFTIYNAAGGAIWALTFSLLGFVFGRNLPRLIHYIGRVSLLLAILIALIVGLVFMWRWFQRNRTRVVERLDERWSRASTSAFTSEMRAHHPVAWSVWRRYGRGEYLTLHLLIGFVVCVAVIGIFSSITEGLVDSSPLTRFDVVVAARLRESAAPAALRWFDVISGFGGRGAMTLLLIAGGFVYALKRQALELTGWTAAFVGGSLLDAALRFVVRRSELPFADIVLLEWGTGLASGHLLGVVVGYGMLAHLVCGFLKGATWRTLVIIVTIGVVSLIAIGRLYLGQHYVSDASAGAAAGLLWLTTCISGLEIARQRRWDPE